MGRIEILCSYIDNCQSFADVGCDHGYCTEYALKSGKCKSAIIADVSAKCLAKAEKLLSGYIMRGVCRSVCCDGLSGIP
ncbi:MAG: class I SAM-dependent methyltransferase, partial [Clostridia bacterium]|nr:class I SAM-dependent methyltransferase [Clostridia bacterium]